MIITIGKSLYHVKTRRAAVVPYTIKKKTNEMFFLLGIDGKTKNITDFGGGVKKFECALKGCIREFKEETKGVFGNLYNTYNNFAVNIAVYNEEMSVLFVPVDEGWIDKVVVMFRGINISSKSNNEISGLRWFSENDFKRIINNREMWFKIKDFYRKVLFNPSFIATLRKFYRI